MKVLPFYIVFLAASYGSWHFADTWYSAKQKELNRQRVGQEQLASQKSTAAEKARLVLSYAKKPVSGDAVETARTIKPADLEGAKYTGDLANKDFAAKINSMMEDEKLVGIASLQVGMTTKIEINDLRGSPAATLRLLHQIDKTLPELRFVKCSWEATDSAPVGHVEYDVWKPTLTAQN